MSADAMPDGTSCAPSLVELRKWFHEHKETAECKLAMKHRNVMDPAIVSELKSRAPGETDEERELAMLFALTQVAEKLDTFAVLLANVRGEHLPPIDLSAIRSVPLDVHRVAVEELEARLNERDDNLSVAAARANDAVEQLNREREARENAEAEAERLRAELEHERAKNAQPENVATSHVDVTPLAPVPEEKPAEQEHPLDKLL